jgi:hypothetical protein
VQYVTSFVATRHPPLRRTRVSSPCLRRAPRDSNACTHPPAAFRRSAMEDRRVIAASLGLSTRPAVGTVGAATKLGILPSTLESKIRSLKMNEYSFEDPAGK